MIASVNSISLTIPYHLDGGHGWLEVSYAHLQRLGIAQHISRCSYRDVDTVYLEEDCDAALFYDVASAAGWDIRFETIVHDGYAPLCRFPRYTPG